MKNYKTCLVSILFGLLAAANACAQSIVGAWTIGGSTAEGASVIVFLANGIYVQIQNARADEAPHGFDGFERGTYTWNQATGAFAVTTIQDLNGDTGLSNISGMSGITLTVTGDTATVSVAGGSVTATRVTGASPIVGAWGGASPAPDDTGVIVFLPNGVYFMAQDGDSTAATGDPSGHDGIEHGTYSWDPATGVITTKTTPAPYVDTNGEWGFSHPQGTSTARVSPDGLTLTLADNSGSFAAPRIGAAAVPTVPLNQQGLTGSYYEPATSGQGFEVEIWPDLVGPGTGYAFVSWFTFDTVAVAGDASRQRWYTLQGSVVNGQPAALTIFQNVGGNFNAGPKTSPQAVGTATLSFESCTSGTLTYTFNDGRSGTIPLTRLTPNVTCSTTGARPTNPDFALSGNWYVAATDGQGFTVEINPNNAFVFFAWYTYAPQGSGAGAAGQRWYTGQGSYTPGSRSMAVPLYQTVGGQFDATSPLPTTATVGTGTLTFQDCGHATLNFNFTAGSSSGSSDTIALTRVGPVPAGCTGTSSPFAGAYQTRVSLVPGQNTCGNVAVQDAVTTVTHTPGNPAISLTHAGNTYMGNVADDNRFMTLPKVLDGGGRQFTINIGGQFTTAGFTATVRVDQTGPACFYLVDWIGVRS